MDDIPKNLCLNIFTVKVNVTMPRKHICRFKIGYEQTTKKKYNKMRDVGKAIDRHDETCGWRTKGEQLIVLTRLSGI